MKSSVGAWASAALAVALAASPAASEGAQVLVFGSQASLLHDASGAASFSAAGLQQLAKDALGLPTATKRVADALEAPASAFSPVQADVFAHTSGYALVLTEDRSAPSAVNAALDKLLGSSMYHKLFPVSTRGVSAAAVALASEFRSTDGLYCAGSVSRCADILETSSAVASVDADALASQLTKNAFLDAKDPADVAFAQELAQVAQLNDALTLQQTLGQESSALYVVALSDPSLLDESKQSAARQAVTTQVTGFLAALQTAHSLAGAQIVVVKRHAGSLNGVAAVSRRKLDSTEDTDDESEGEDEDDEEDEDEEDEDEDDEDEELNLAAEDGSNATAAGNSTAHSPLSIQDIAEYQIVLWTSVLLAAALLLAIVAMGNMDVGRDSLLYAKFTTAAGHRKAD